MAAKHFNRFKQLAGEKLSVREKSDRLTSSLSEAEKKVEEIRSSCQSVIKRLHACNQGSGSTFEKHQKKLPHYALGVSMMESATSMEASVLSNILKEVGQAQLDISSHLTEYEMAMENDIIQNINSILEECKKVDKAKKKLSSARLDMDGTRNRYQSIQDKFSPRAETVKSELDQAISHFEQCQDTYATELFSFLSKERELADLMHKMTVLQITHLKEKLNVLDEILPRLNKTLDVSAERPAFGFCLLDHLKLTERTISYVIEECCLELRRRGMKMEGIFRLAASAAKLKLLKNAFDAASADVSTHDPHTVAGALKQYLRELPDPILTHELHADWVAAAGVANEGERMQQLWSVTQNLAPENRENLRYLMWFLHDLSKYHEHTKMNVNNIAIVIGPNLLWSKNETMQGLVGETALYTRIADCFVRHPSYFFGDPPALPDDLASPDVKEEPPLFSPTNEPSTPVSNEDCDFEQAPTDPGDLEQQDTSSLNKPHALPITTEERPTPPARRNRSIKRQQPQPDASPIPSSPKTPTGRPSRPAPQPPPSRSKARPPPPSPPREKSSPALLKEKPSPPPPFKPKDSSVDEETVL
ncbi:PREDICTED: rho GTPase-activating protein 17-like [Amphimedon queenslandica]|uniref:Rho-GAP domain-containing protein n=1 Tax=Amphimedon queenslandica TaxID=400682 RepID=A0A1X7V681_AMPQE|nr:PREDICTED: rho GTPase-activating protein 17-like [Amphimedon queenslandica]|eukprot:XP_003385510.1 PREDICTED: rho GTPase-activating protein 17-like [Amphimedon queenslandica]